MELVKHLGVRGTGSIDKRYNTERTVSFGLFKCACGHEQEITLSRGLKQTCCLACRGSNHATHGMSGTKPYQVWRGMHSRCSNPNNKKYHIYGGKGITICEKWRTFEGFWEDNKDQYQPNLTIDRIDSNQGYFPENVRWISHSRNSSETSKRRAVAQYRLITEPVKDYVLVQEWESAKRAADSLQLTAAHITAACAGNRKTHGGFVWKYV